MTNNIDNTKRQPIKQLEEEIKNLELFMLGKHTGFFEKKNIQSVIEYLKKKSEIS